jgi:hypothetical protein
MLDYLTTLRAELIHKILDNVPSLDILSSLCFANKRIRSISLAYRHIQLTFSCVDTLMEKDQFDSVCTQLLYSTSRNVFLTLFDEDDAMMPVKNALFLSCIIITDRTCPKLRSLTLTYTTYDTWYLFRTRLPPLIVALSIELSYSGMLTCLPTTYVILSELLFLSPALQHLSAKMAGFMDGKLKIRPRNTALLSSFQYFHLEFVEIDLLSILTIASMLHTLECIFVTPNLKSGRIHCRRLYL